MELAPILLFVYNRPGHAKKTIDALKTNNLANQSELFIFSDGPKNSHEIANVDAVRNYIREIDGFKMVKIFEAEKNKGLANSIISGVNKLFDNFEKLIVLEDDLETSVNFIEYMNDALNVYKNSYDIWSISGYNPPIIIPESYEEQVYLSYRASSWGWATWKDRWKKNDWEIKDFRNFSKNKTQIEQFNRGGLDMFSMLRDQMDGKLDSWAIRWCYNQFKNNSFCIYPVKSKVRNIGTDASGIHCGVRKKYDVKIDTGEKKTILTKALNTNEEILNRFSDYYGTKMKVKIVTFLKFLGMYNFVKTLLERLRYI